MNVPMKQHQTTMNQYVPVNVSPETSVTSLVVKHSAVALREAGFDAETVEGPASWRQTLGNQGVLGRRC